MASRQARPYPPAHLQINGDDYPDLVVGDLVCTWAHRDRLLEADQLIDQTTTDIGPEAGTTYTWRLYVAGVLERQEACITATRCTCAPVATGGAFHVELLAVRAGLESWQMQTRDFTYGLAYLIDGSGASLDDGAGSLLVHP